MLLMTAQFPKQVKLVRIHCVVSDGGVCHAEAEQGSSTLLHTMENCPMAAFFMGSKNPDRPGPGATVLPVTLQTMEIHNS